jgi:hypothetical protein
VNSKGLAPPQRLGFVFPTRTEACPLLCPSSHHSQGKANSAASAASETGSVGSIALAGATGVVQAQV